jgi:hypothetical protein
MSCFIRASQHVRHSHICRVEEAGNHISPGRWQYMQRGRPFREPNRRESLAKKLFPMLIF